MTGADWIRWGAFLLYTGQLAREDCKSGTFYLRTLLAGGLCGLLLRMAEVIRQTAAAADILPGMFFSLLPGLGLLLLGKMSRGAVGSGDGLCFLSFAFWWSGEQVFSLLLLSLSILGCTGLFLICFRKRDRGLRLPFGPFILAAACVQLILSLLMPL